MALVIRILYRELLKLNVQFNKDPRVRGLPLIGSPIPAIIVVTFYLLFVNKWGVKWMKDRKPYNVKLLIQIHNVLQVVINGYMFITGPFYSYLRNDFSWTCEPVDYHNTSPSKMWLIYLTYIYYLTKYLDLFDTVFFVLRKKNNQITFLHVYHHAFMVLIIWLYTTFTVGSHGTMLGIINAFVHMVMYTYYLVSSMDLKIDLTPWKKRITQIQILQFCYLSIHFTIPVLKKSCDDPFKIVYGLGVVQNFFMAAMFSDFYYKAYVKKRTNNKKIT